MTVANHLAYDAGFLGGMGTQLQVADLTPDDVTNRPAAIETKYVRLQSG